MNMSARVYPAQFRVDQVMVKREARPTNSVNKLGEQALSEQAQ